MRREAGRRMIHRLRQTEGLAESLAAEVNILTPSRHEHMHERCTHCTGLYLDDKWQYKPHSLFTLFQWLEDNVFETKTWQNSTSQHT